MNSKSLYTGLGLFLMEFLGVLFYFIITSINWTIDTFVKVIAGSCIALFNIIAFILVIVGLLSDENRR